MKALALDPDNPEVIYAGINTHALVGLYKSSDGGRSWKLLKRQPVSSITINPVNPRQIYVTGGMLMRTDDGGANWTEPNPYAFTYSGLFMHPKENGKLFAYNYWGISGSSDHGAKWEELIQQVGITSIEADPQRPGIFFAGATKGTYSNGGILVSTENGARHSWNRVFSDPDINAIVPHRADRQVIFASSGASGVVRSGDGGKTWAVMNNALTGKPVKALVGHPTEHTRLYAGTLATGVYQSADSGESWAEHNKGLEAVDVLRIVIHPKEPGTIFIGTSKGVYRWAAKPLFTPAPPEEEAKPAVPARAPAVRPRPTAKPAEIISRGDSGNNPPVIEPFFRSEQRYSYDEAGRMTGVVLSLSVEVRDPDGDPLTYEWSATTGTISGSGPQVTWTPPMRMGEPESGVVTVVVSDPKGGKARHQFNVRK